MWTGRQTLGEIEGAIAKLHQDEGQLDTALASATAKAEQLRRDRGDAFRELARIKLGEIDAGRLVRNLDTAERRAVQILESRRLRLANANEQRTAAIAEVARAEADRNAAAAAVEQALAAVEATRLRAEKAVKTTPAWTDASKAVSFGIAATLWVICGAFIMAVARGTFRWEGFGSVEDIGNHLGGAVLMGFGGITALGCTIGQGLSGISLLSVGAMLSVVGIAAGARVATSYQMWRVGL